MALHNCHDGIFEFFHSVALISSFTHSLIHLSLSFLRYRPPTSHVQAWYDEVRDYSFPYPQECNPYCPFRCSGPVCTHYTQVRTQSSTHFEEHSFKGIVLQYWHYFHAHNHQHTLRKTHLNILGNSIAITYTRTVVNTIGL